MDRSEICRPVRSSGWWTGLALALVLPLVLVTVGCASTTDAPSHEDPAVRASSSSAVQVAFSGGGWRAHTAASGWILALLDDGAHSLDEVLLNVDTMASNSGGSWFNAMLVYSEDFVSAIEAPDALATWAEAGPHATGWLGQQQYIFDQTILCGVLEGVAYLVCVLEEATDDEILYWRDIVEDVVFRHQHISGGLEGARQPWAEDKAVLLAGSLLTAEVVLGESGFDQIFYQACLSPSTPQIEGEGASCTGPEASPPIVTPVTFASLPSGSTWTAPPFFWVLEAEGGGRQFNLGYTTDSDDPSRPMALAVVTNPPASDGVPVMTAAAASSAAVGFAASDAASHDWWVSYGFADEALNFQMEGGPTYVVADGLSVDEMARDEIVQIADGGSVDNSAVAQVVSFLQLDGRADGFEIVAFDNVRESFSPGGSGADIGPDLANLFGQDLCPGDRVCAGASCEGPCIVVPSAQVFDGTPLTTTPTTWSAEASTNAPPLTVHELIYTRYEVTTVDNSTFGVAAGMTGTLHAFTCIWSDAETAPENGTTDFDAYAAMLDFIDAGLQEADSTGTTGLQYLREALGLSP